MPGTDGFELAKKIFQTPELETCRLVLLTSDDTPDDVLRYRSLGITAIVTKPVQQEELIDRVYRVLAQDVPGPAAHRDATTPAAPVPATPPSGPRRRLKVLLAEDNEFNQQVTQQLLVRHGHAVQLARDGKETLAALEREAFDLLLLDLHMPEMDGFEVIRALRAREKSSAAQHLPVVALTALSMKGDRERCLRAGMDAYVAKPIHPADFYATIDRVTGATAVPNDRPSTAAGAPANVSALLDAATLLRSCGGDAALMEEMIRLFAAEAPAQLAAVEAAVAKQSSAQLREAAHKLRGLVAAFSTRIAAEIAMLEQMGADGRCADAHEHYATVAEDVRVLLAPLANLTIEQLRHLSGSKSDPTWQESGSPLDGSSVA
jgi:CheY-like chemotaxis protein